MFLSTTLFLRISKIINLDTPLNDGQWWVLALMSPPPLPAAHAIFLTSTAEAPEFRIENLWKVNLFPTQPRFSVFLVLNEAVWRCSQYTLTTQTMLASIKHFTGCCFVSPFRSTFDKIVSLLNWHTWTLIVATKLSHVLNGRAVTHANILPQHVRRYACNITYISSILQWFCYVFIFRIFQLVQLN